MFDLKLTGSGITLKKLERAAQRVQHKEIRDELKSAMHPALELARQRASVQSGRMRRWLSITARSNRKGAIAALSAGTRRALRIPESSKYYYPAAIEYGTRFMRAKPFLRNSLADKRGEIMSAIRSTIRNKLRRL